MRKAIFQVHLWTGLGTGLYMFAVGVSGSLLVFRPEVYKEYWQSPVIAVRESPRLGQDALKAAAARAYPGYTVTDLLESPKPTAPTEVWVEREGRTRKRWFDPYTGGDLGETTPGLIKLFEWTLHLHDELLAGDVGRTFNGVGALCLTLLSLTGAVIWWPGSRNWRRSLGVQRKRLAWSLHSAVGFWSFILVFIWAASGVYLVFQGPFQAIVDYLEPFDPGSLGPRRGDTILAWVTRLHFGRFAGLPLKILYTGLGLVLPVLFVTGTIMWWNRVVRFRKIR
ncbi:MAG: PepSY domain-containing protein [Gemmatimonadetes bacterium]|nr:PepSY domain-containing protein [Gemmatimonadota bacterium]